ncbi:MAG: bifunctional hydroxymethylpyrimidine kinase/phosphomethylpyrimidine kinase [Kiritimatiellales bacterium]
MIKPVVWTIAGSDSGGGAGIQADIKVMNLLGVHACSVITALTAQNTIGTGKLEWVAAEMLTAQLEALQSDLPPVAIKIGMLGTKTAVETVTGFMKKNPEPFIVCDPVLISSSGTFLLEADAWKTITEKLFPAVTLITPNIPETEHLFGLKIKTPADIEAAAQKALAAGAKEILIKGGHGRHNVELSSDYWTNGEKAAWMSSPRIETRSSHGTGCFLSSAIAALRAKGYAPLDSILSAKAFLNQALRQAPELGNGFGPLAFNPWAKIEEDFPSIQHSP